MSVMERSPDQQQRNQRHTSSSITNYSSEFIDASRANLSRRSIDWRDSGIVIDDENQFEFNALDTLVADNPNELRRLDLGQFELRHELEAQNRHSSQRPTLLSVDSNSQICPSQRYFLQQDDDGDTLLHLAVVGFSVEKVQDLMKISNVNAINNMMQTPLHVSILANRPEMVHVLIKTPDIKLDCYDRKGNAPIHLACQMGSKDIVEILLTSFGTIADSGNRSKVRSMLELTNFDGQTCLHLAASNGHREIIELLVKNYQANINCRDSKSGETILHIAIGRLNVDLVESILRLFEAHQDLEHWHFNKKDFSGRGPLDKVRIMLESRDEDQTRIDRLHRIAQIISERARRCSSSGCSDCSSPKSEVTLRVLDNRHTGALMDDEIASSSCSSPSSDFSDSDDYCTD